MLYKYNARQIHGGWFEKKGIQWIAYDSDNHNWPTWRHQNRWEQFRLTIYFACSWNLVHIVIHGMPSLSSYPPYMLAATLWYAGYRCWSFDILVLLSFTVSFHCSPKLFYSYSSFQCQKRLHEDSETIPKVMFGCLRLTPTQLGHGLDDDDVWLFRILVSAPSSHL